MDSNVPPVMAKLITNCWAQLPAERPSMEEVMTILRDLAIQSSPDSFRGETRVTAPTGNVVLIQTVSHCSVVGRVGSDDIISIDSNCFAGCGGRD